MLIKWVMLTQTTKTAYDIFYFVLRANTYFMNNYFKLSSYFQ